MGLFVSLMDIYDQTQARSANILFMPSPKREAQTSIINKLKIQNATKKTLWL